jgi:hypothetical protein
MPISSVAVWHVGLPIRLRRPGSSLRLQALLLRRRRASSRSSLSRRTRSRRAATCRSGAARRMPTERCAVSNNGARCILVRAPSHTLGAASRHACVHATTLTCHRNLLGDSDAHEAWSTGSHCVVFPMDPSTERSQQCITLQHRPEHVAACRIMADEPRRSHRPHVAVGYIRASLAWP